MIYDAALRRSVEVPDSFMVVRSKGREKTIVDDKGLRIHSRYRHCHRKGRLCTGEDTLRLPDGVG